MMRNMLSRLADYQEADEIVEETGIPGLFWKRNDYYRTTALSPDPAAEPGPESVHGGIPC